MTKEEILSALRFLAMGRPNHPQAEQLAEELAKLFAKPERKKAEKAD